MSHPCRIFQRESGQSLIIVMMSAAIGMVVALGMTAALSNLQLGANSIKFRTDGDTANEEIRSLLSSPQACLNSFGGMTVTSTMSSLAVTQLLDGRSPPGVQYKINNAACTDMNDPSRGCYGDRTLKLHSMQLAYYQDSEASTKLVKLLSSFESNKTASGPQFVNREVIIKAQLDSSNNIIGCIALSKMTDGIWQRSQANTNDIFYTAPVGPGRVGIGTANPDTMLGVSANSTSLTPNQGSLLHLTGANQNSVAITQDAFGDGHWDANYFTQRRAGGTAAAPGLPRVWDVLGSWQILGWNGGGWSGASGFTATATEDWTATGHGTKIELFGITNGTLGPPRAVVTVTGTGIGVGTGTWPSPPGDQPLNAIDVAGGMVVGSGYAGIATAPTNGLLVAGNVGIGTTAPAFALDVGGQIRTPSAVIIGDNSGGNGFHITNDGSSTGLRFYTGTYGSGNLRAQISENGNALFGLNGGQVGIGTTAPTGMLHSNATGFTPSNSTVVNAAVVTSGSYGGGLTMNDGGGLGSIWMQNFGTEMHFGLGTTAGVADRLVLNGNGVGIGSTNPQSRLDVNGEVRVGESGAACSGSNEGSIRYNYGAHNMEYCGFNGASYAWMAMGAGAWPPGSYCIVQAQSQSCPSGFTATNPSIADGTDAPWYDENTIIRGSGSSYTGTMTRAWGMLTPWGGTGTGRVWAWCCK